jgi:hypothetical protein
MCRSRARIRAAPAESPVRVIYAFLSGVKAENRVEAY